MATSSRSSAQRRAPQPGRKPGVRKQAAQVTQDNILRAATRIFAKSGFSGGRVDQISKAARSYDRMIYYYYGSKEQLFIAVIEDLYRRFNEAESSLPLDEHDPEKSLIAVVQFIWDYYQNHPEFITLLNDENLHRGKHISKSLRAKDYSSAATGIVSAILAQGVARGIFRSDIRARDLYLAIASMNYFYLSNKYTLSAFFGEKLDHPDALAHWQSFVVDAILRIVRK